MSVELTSFLWYSLKEYPFPYLYSYIRPIHYVNNWGQVNIKTMIYLSKSLCSDRNSSDVVFDFSIHVCYNGSSTRQGLILVRPVDFVFLEQFDNVSCLNVWKVPNLHWPFY